MTDTDYRISVTLKGNGQYDQPWVVVKGNSPAEINDTLLAIESSGVLTTVGRVAEAHKAHVAVGASLGATPVSPPPAAPQAVSGPPSAPAAPVQGPTDQGPPPGSGAVPSCVHGPRVYKQSKPGAAKAWAAYMCPLPQGRKAEQCAPEWVN